MTPFTEIPLTNRAASGKRLVHGIGVNDSPYVVQPYVGGKRACCPYYKIWSEMLRRCYSKKQHSENPAYVGCTVCPEWRLFSNFKTWAVTQDWEGKHIDKDILVPGNREYAPHTCIFVPPHVNMLLTDHKSARGEYPQGVILEKKTGNFLAQCHRGNDSRYVGRFNTPGEAYEAYKKAKTKEIRRVADTQPDVIREALYARANQA